MSPAHANEMVEVLADLELYRFTGGQPPLQPELKARYRAQVNGPDIAGEHWCNWIVRRVSDGRAVGHTQGTISDAVASVAWVIGLHHQGKGLATEAAKAMCGWLVEGGVIKIAAHIHPDHAASKRVATKIGLEESDTIDDGGEVVWELTYA